MAQQVRYTLSKMSDEEIRQLMKSVTSDVEDTGDEGDIGFEEEDGDANASYICAADELFIENILNSTELIQNTIDTSIDVNNITEYEQNPTTSTSAILNASPPKNLRARKRKTVVEFESEDHGPSSVPSTFSGVVKDIKNDAPEIKSMIWKKKI